MEPSAACNLDCQDCPTASGRGGGVMHIEDFIHVIKQLPWLKFLNLWHRGEPLVAPEFTAMVTEASARKIWTQTHTNGILLAKTGLAKEIVKSGLNRITIGIDGADEETYSAIRQGGSLADVEKGVRALVEARRSLGSSKLKIIAECLISRQSKEEFHTIHDLALLWGCDEVKFKTYRVSLLEDEKDALLRLPDDPKLWRYKHVNDHLEMNKTRSSCRRLAYSAVVGWNGEVLPCCFSTNDFHSMGNAFKQPWSEIWKGKQLTEFQRVVNHGGRDKIPMCRNCTEGLTNLYLPRKAVCQ